MSTPTFMISLQPRTLLFYLKSGLNAGVKISAHSIIRFIAILGFAIPEFGGH